MGTLMDSKITRRTFLVHGSACMASAWLPSALSAPDYPARPVTIVVPYGPGSFMDTVTRPFAVALQKSLGQPVIIDNKGGASGVIGTQSAARANPDGYTLLVGSTSTLAANVGLFRNLPYDPLKDFVPVAGIASTSMILLISASSPHRDLKSFLGDAGRQQKPLAMGYGSASAQVALAQLTQVSGVEFVGVPYKSSPQAVTDLLGGQVSAVLVDLSNGMPHVRSGSLVALSISGQRRSLAAPDVPTLSEVYPGTELVTWVGLVAVKNTPEAVLVRLGRAAKEALAMPQVKDQFTALAADIEPMSSETLGNIMESDQKKWLSLIEAAHIEPM